MFGNVGLYAKSIVAVLADVGYLAQAAIADGAITPSEWGVFVAGLFSAAAVLVVPNAKSSDAAK